LGRLPQEGCVLSKVKIQGFGPILPVIEIINRPQGRM